VAAAVTAPPRPVGTPAQPAAARPQPAPEALAAAVGRLLPGATLLRADAGSARLLGGD